MQTEIPRLSREELDRKEREMVSSRKGRKPGIKLPALRLVRVYRDMTALDLEKVSGVTRQTVARAESGGGVNALTVEKLAKALNVRPETLTRDFGNLEPEEDEEL